MKTYPAGSTVKVSMVIKDSTGALQNPTTTTVVIQTPGEVSTTYLYGTDAELVRDSTGNFHINVAATETGTYDAVSTGTTAGIAVVGTTSFNVV